MKKIAIHLPINGRLNIARVAIAALERTRQQLLELGYSSTVHVAGATQPERDLADEYDYEFYAVRNQPLGYKFNQLAKSMHQTRWDYYMEYGADNVLSTEYAKRAAELLDAGTPAFGLRDFYILDEAGKKPPLLFTGGFSNIGRITARAHTEKILNKRGELYPWRLKRRLDSAFYKIHSRYFEAHTPIPSETPLLVDIKGPTNLNPYDDFPNRKPVYLTGEFPEVTQQEKWQPQEKSGRTPSASTSAPPADPSPPTKQEEPSETTRTKTTHGNSSPAPPAARSRGRSKPSTRRRKTTTDKGKSSPAGYSGA